MKYGSGPFINRFQTGLCPLLHKYSSNNGLESEAAACILFPVRTFDEYVSILRMSRKIGPFHRKRKLNLLFDIDKDLFSCFTTFSQ